jgi:hypothetical protein
MTDSALVTAVVVPFGTLENSSRSVSSARRTTDCVWDRRAVALKAVSPEGATTWGKGESAVV